MITIVFIDNKHYMLNFFLKIIINHENLINSAIREGGMWLGEKMRLQGLTMSRGKMFPRGG
jgi:hypothetical protein